MRPGKDNCGALARPRPIWLNTGTCSPIPGGSAMSARRSRRKFLCVDCSVDTGKLGEFYFLKTPLWLSVMPGGNGMLCVGCLENRLGRRLTPSDFASNIYINAPGFGAKSHRLLSRLVENLGRIIRSLLTEYKYRHAVAHGGFFIFYPAISKPNGWRRSLQET